MNGDQCSSRSEVGKIEKKNPAVVEVSRCSQEEAGTTVQNAPPLRLKVISTLFVCAMGFGTYYNQGVLGAVKTPLKKELGINNTQFSLIASTQDLCVMLLIVVGGIVADYIGGAGAVVLGSATGVGGSILVASAVSAKSYKLMVVGSGILSLGNLIGSTARYRLFSSWFPPNHGFSFTLSLEIAAAKVGSLVSKATANPIADSAGGLAWAFWAAMFADVFVFCIALAVLAFVRRCRARYPELQDPSTGERLLERTKRFEPRRVLELPWAFWCIVLFHVFQTTNHLTFLQNATELAEMRFHVGPKTAGWISGLVVGGNFFLLPLFGALVELRGHRLSLMAALGAGMTAGMALLRWAPSKAGSAAAYAVLGVCVSPTFFVAYDGVRASLWHQEVYGTANSVKVAMGCAVNMVVRVGIGLLQDRDRDGYQRVVLVYLALGVGAALVGAAMLVASRFTVDLAHFQWSRRQRAARGELLVKRTEAFDELVRTGRNWLGVVGAAATLLFILGGIAAYVYAAQRHSG